MGKGCHGVQSLTRQVKTATGAGRVSRRGSDSRRCTWRQRILAVVLILIIVPGLVAFYAFQIEPGRLAVRRETLVFPNLPDEWDGRTLVFFTDVHAGPSFPPERIERVAKAIRKESPDLVLFGGDLIDSETPHDETFTRRVSDALSAIDAPLGKLAVIGNHDNRLKAELKLARSMLEDGGLTLLVNQSVTIGEVTIGGLDESYFGSPDFKQTFASVPDERFRIVLMHQPDFLPSQPDLACDLVLSGHSHNGQVTLLGNPLVKVYGGSKYPYGFYQLDDRRQLYVSSGLGTVVIHARLFAPPEIVVITLSRKASGS